MVTIYLCTTIARRLHCDLPGCQSKRAASSPMLSHRTFTLFGLAPDGVYRADAVTCAAGALLPHRFTLTTRPSFDEPFGGLLSVALSLTSRPVDVIDHPALRSPDFPPAVSTKTQPAITPLTRKRSTENDSQLDQTQAPVNEFT